MYNIALISFSNNYDMQKYVFSLYESLKEKYKGKIVTLTSQKTYFDINYDDNNFFINVPKRPGLEFKTFNFFEIKKIIKVLKSKRIDLIYFLSSHVWNIFLINTLKKYGVKIIHSIHDPIPHEGEKDSNNVRIYNKYISKKSDIVILHSEKLKIPFIKTYSISNTKVKVIPLWHEWKPFHKIEQNKNKVLFFGRINPYKGVENIIELAKLNNNIIFDIVGKISKKLEHLKIELKKYKNINLVDEYVDEYTMDKFFYDNQITILPYNSATQSGVVVESYRHSRPIIGFNVGAISEQVPLEFRDFFLLESGDIIALNNTLKKYLNLSIKEKNYICKAFYDYGFNKFSVLKASEFFLQLIRNIEIDERR
ncbi:glycosyltransferase family 4 protein [Marinitoga sp. 38H-ov]|uniref:glycosyltransferase family 4 protein n=1 Tax=Marinitoga sp. 38H-ov TaxID=1755814 RepID=UPI0013EDB3E3|nr:glycosyltransferase family 4 protein [Marinitoga sp. 38H-ov]KAF2955600.1 hypothetical protein AS160_09520 [Marinitoga sp. 38H-ov]